MTKRANCSKKNFWNDIRVDSGYNYKELQELLGINKYSISSYFSGRSVPSRKSSDKICDLYQIDRDEGYLQFIAMHDAYVKPDARPIVKKAEPKHVDECKIAVVDTPKQKIDTFKKQQACLRKLYDTISFDDYEYIRDAFTSGCDPLEILYNRRIPFELYNQVRKLLS